MRAFTEFPGPNDLIGCFAKMAPRLVNLRRAHKPAGTLCLHCDPAIPAQRITIFLASM